MRNAIQLVEISCGYVMSCGDGVAFCSLRKPSAWGWTKPFFSCLCKNRVAWWLMYSYIDFHHYVLLCVYLTSLSSELQHFSRWSNPLNILPNWHFHWRMWLAYLSVTWMLDLHCVCTEFDTRRKWSKVGMFLSVQLKSGIKTYLYLPNMIFVTSRQVRKSNMQLILKLWNLNPLVHITDFSVKRETHFVQQLHVANENYLHIHSIDYPLRQTE